MSNPLRITPEQMQEMLNALRQGNYFDGSYITTCLSKQDVSGLADGFLEYLNKGVNSVGTSPARAGDMDLLVQLERPRS